MRKQITSTLELLLGVPGRTIKFVDNFDTAFKSLDEYTESSEIKSE